jgi:hypothetical protein
MVYLRCGKVQWENNRAVTVDKCEKAMPELHGLGEQIVHKNMHR